MRKQVNAKTTSAIVMGTHIGDSTHHQLQLMTLQSLRTTKVTVSTVKMVMPSPTLADSLDMVTSPYPSF